MVGIIYKPKNSFIPIRFVV